MRIVSASIFSGFPEVRFAFSTRDGNNVHDYEQSFLRSAEVETKRLAIPKQVHGKTVMKVSAPGVYPDSDALITNQRDVFLQVSVADCLSIFLYDQTSHSVGAVHAGWRGSVEKITLFAFQRMVQEFSAKPETTRVFIGPSARSCCYEIGEDVASQFDEQFVMRKPNTRPHLDMQSFNVSVLTSLGIQKLNIEVSPHCTICTPELFHSYRRDGTKAGRMIGILGLQSVDF